MRPVFICPKALQAKSPVQKLRALAYHNARVVSVDTNSGCIIVDILATTDSLYSNIFHSRRICIEQYHFLTRLSPGKHRLEVQSTDRYGRLVENTRYAILARDTLCKDYIRTAARRGCMGGNLHLHIHKERRQRAPRASRKIYGADAPRRRYIPRRGTGHSLQP